MSQPIRGPLLGEQENRLQRRSRFRIAFGISALASLAVLASTTTAVTASASGEAAQKAGRLPATRQAAKGVKPDFSFYVGKTVTLVVPASVGGSNDDVARIMAPLMASYLHCNINIENNAAGADVGGQDQTAGAVPNGLTIGQMIPASDIARNAISSGSLTFNLLKVPEIAGTSPGAGSTVVAQSNYPIKTMTELVHTKTTVPMLEEGLSDTFVEMELFLLAYNVHGQYISAYSSGAAVEAGFIRGDAPVAIQGYTVFQSLITSGKAIPLVITDGVLKGMVGYNLMKKIPDFAEYAAANPPKTPREKKKIDAALSLATLPANILFAPIGTPAPLVAALTAAAHSALAQPGARAAELADSLGIAYVSPAQGLAGLKKATRLEPTLAQYLAG